MLFEPTKEQKEYVNDLIDKWRQILFLDAWTIERSCSDVDDPTDDGVATTLARNASDSKYLHAQLTFYPKFFKKV